MSFFSKVFGGKKEQAGPTTTEAIQSLRETEEMLIKKQEFLERKIEQEIVTAKKNGTKNKRGIFAHRNCFVTNILIWTTFQTHWVRYFYDVTGSLKCNRGTPFYTIRNLISVCEKSYLQ